MCLNGTYIKVRICKHVSDAFPTWNGPKLDALSPLLFNFTSEYAIRKIQELNGTYQLLVYADDRENQVSSPDTGQNHHIAIANKSFENVAKFKHFRTTTAFTRIIRAE
jgi:hypothetical protein